MPRGVGGDQRAIQRAATGRRHALHYGRSQDLTIQGLQRRPDSVAEGIAARPRRRDPRSQPLKASAIAHILSPLIRRMATEMDLRQDDLEEQIGPMGLGPDAEIRIEQGRQIESVDGLVDGAGEMVSGEGVLDLEPLEGLTIPGRRGEAIELGAVRAWVRVERGEEVEGTARRLRPRMVLRSRRWDSALGCVSHVAAGADSPVTRQ